MKTILLLKPIDKTKFAGSLIFISMIGTVIASVNPYIQLGWTGALYWMALAILWNNLSTTNKKQAFLLSGMGIAGMLFGQDIRLVDQFEKIAAVNNNIISLMIAVGFISIKPQPIKVRKKIQGAKAVISNFMGVHIIGSVINYGAVIIFGDRMAKDAGLQRSHAIILSRSFASAGFWSPFFMTMAVALNFSPGHNYILLAGIGIFFALITLLITTVELELTEKKAPFVGQPIEFSFLLRPLLLACAVVSFQYIFPEMSILLIITILSPLIGIISLIRHPEASQFFIDYVSQRLPKHCNELALFLSAGIFSIGLANMMQFLPESFTFTSFSFIEAAFCFLMIVSLALLGIHPLISITFFHNLLQSSHSDPNLMALVFFSAWALSSAVGPLSGQNLGIQGRYNIKSYDIMKWNINYMVLMSLTIISIMYLIS